MTTQRRALGTWGEDIAARHLREQGLAVLDRNWRRPDGEVDLILRDGRVLVFCEVKTRRGEAFGPPAAAITHEKMLRLRRLANLWLQETSVRAPEVRFDVVEIIAGHGGTPLIRHIRAAF